MQEEYCFLKINLCNPEDRRDTETIECDIFYKNFAYLRVDGICVCRGQVTFVRRAARPIVCAPHLYQSRTLQAVNGHLLRSPTY